MQGSPGIRLEATEYSVGVSRGFREYRSISDDNCGQSREGGGALQKVIGSAAEESLGMIRKILIYLSDVL
jgi:hypothetical protein